MTPTPLDYEERLSRRLAQQIESRIVIDEEEWLISTDCRLMYSYINDGTEAWQYQHGVTEEGNKHFADACYNACTCKEKPETLKRHTAEQWTYGEATGCGTTKELRSQLLREIFGNPFRPVIREFKYLIDPAAHARVYNAAKEIAKREVIEAIIPHIAGDHETNWLKLKFKDVLPTLIFKEQWITPQVISLAKRIDEEGDYGLMPILADAMEDTGCSNRQVLDHCRPMTCTLCSGEKVEYKAIKDQPSLVQVQCPLCKGSGILDRLHTKGCWVISLLLEEHKG